MMNKIFKKICLRMLEFIGIFSIFLADHASNYCIFIFNYEPEMPISMLETNTTNS